MSKIVFFGAGKIFSDIVQIMETQREIFNDTIVCVLDNDTTKMDSCIHGYKIVPPAKLLHVSFDYIVIACRDYENISRQLENDYFIEPALMISVRDYKRKKISEYQFQKNCEHLQKRSLKHWTKFSPSSMVVYTAIIGDYDDLKNPAYIHPDWKYVCFTDNPFLKSDIWEIRYIENKSQMDAPLFVRQFKICPHKFFPEYETSIWVDANLYIKKDLQLLIQSYQRHADLLLFPHPERMCIYDEGVLCIYLKKGTKKKILEQIKKYMDENYPFDHGLLYGGFIVRNHNESAIIDAMEKWWTEVKKESRRDQISLPYILWKTKLPFDLTDLNYIENEWFHVEPHKAGWGKN